MLVSSGATSETIFNDIDEVFTNLNIPWIECIGFAMTSAMSSGEGKLSTCQSEAEESKCLQYWVPLSLCHCVHKMVQAPIPR